MHRYYLFSFNEYYPVGGMGDCLLKTNDLEKAKRAFDSESADVVYIYDVEEDKIILEN